MQNVPTYMISTVLSRSFVYAATHSHDVLCFAAEKGKNMSRRVLHFPSINIARFGKDSKALRLIQDLCWVRKQQTIAIESESLLLGNAANHEIFAFAFDFRKKCEGEIKPRE